MTDSTSRGAFDPVALEVARNRLESVAEEIGSTLIRTAYSPNIKDRRDCSAGLYTPDGSLVAQAEHIPLHLGLMPTMIRHALAAVGVSSLRAGDVLVTNDPYLGGSHLPDTCVITPVHQEGRVVAVVANMAHHVDIGGITPGSMATHATEIFQEGVRIPPILLLGAGEVRRDVLALLLANVRTADKTRGDLLAQVAANRVGVRRVEELLAEWGPDYFHDASEALIDYAERRTRVALAALPDGQATFTDYLEHTGVHEADLPIVGRVEKSGDEIMVDFTGTAEQVEGAVNCSYAVAEACVGYAVKSLADPAIPSNAGLMRPITVRTTPGSVVSATFPAPVANGNTQTAQRIVDVLFGAFDRISPGIAPAASSGSMSIVTIGGFDPTTRRYFSYVETYGGGQGASDSQSGADAVHTHMTNTLNTPCEVIEREYPLRVRRYEIARGTGGAGRHRGGDGLVRELELTSGEATAVIATARVTRRPWALHGGEAAQPASVRLTTGASTQDLPAMSSHRMSAGDRLRIQTAGGAGYGPAEPG